VVLVVEVEKDQEIQEEQVMIHQLVHLKVSQEEQEQFQELHQLMQILQVVVEVLVMQVKTLLLAQVQVHNNSL
tara:strand:+ start:75 stop:293 length:219 start_codon:yes stop_codon:yes gene_type:complete